MGKNGAATSTADSLYVWPRPTRTVALGGTSTRVQRQAGIPLFAHVGGCCADLLKEAFDRYERIIYWAEADPATPPHIRVRVPGLRNSTVGPELSRCGGVDDETIFGTLEVHVDFRHPTPLQLHVDESYSLRLTERGGTLTAPTEWGALRGLETFSQLVRWAGPPFGNLLCDLPLRVDDSPTYAWRGLLIDTGRHFYPVADIVRMLDAMAALKLNTLHWHLVDAALFPFGSESMPQLPAAGAMHPSLVYSTDDVRAVVAAARARGIRVVPELDMPAHAASWAHAEPAAVVTCPTRVGADEEGLEHGIDKAALNPLIERTFEVVDALLGELAALFPDEYIHLGGDEVDGDCWLEEPAIRAWARGKGAKWKEKLVALFSARVLERVAQIGKRPIMWDEALEMAPFLPPEAKATQLTIDAWRDWQHLNLGGGGRIERWQSAPAAGHQVVWSSLSWYLDLPQNKWDTIYALQLPSEPPAAFLGGEASSWSESADPTNVQQRALTRLAAAAERLWSGAPSELAVARQRLASVRCRLLRRGLHAEPVIPDYCAVPRATGAERPAATDQEGRAAREVPAPLPQVAQTPTPALPPSSIPSHPYTPALEVPPATRVANGLLGWQVAAGVSIVLNALLLIRLVLPGLRRRRAVVSGRVARIRGRQKEM